MPLKKNDVQEYRDTCPGNCRCDDFCWPLGFQRSQGAQAWREDALRAFSHVRDAAEYINSITREGDLVLLKGANRKDHLQRIILARNGNVACWRDDCNRVSFCNECPDLNKPSGAPLLLQHQTTQSVNAQSSAIGPQIFEPDEQVIVGLGNPEATYASTPHNIGYEVVDQLAASLKLTWDTTPEAWVARGSSNGTCGLSDQDQDAHERYGCRAEATFGEHGI